MSPTVVPRRRTPDLHPLGAHRVSLNGRTPVPIDVELLPQVVHVHTKVHEGPENELQLGSEPRTGDGLAGLAATRPDRDQRTHALLQALNFPGNVFGQHLTTRSQNHHALDEVV